MRRATLEEFNSLQVPLFLIEIAKREGWFRPLITLVHIKDVRRSGYFNVDSKLSIDVNASKTKIYEDIKFLIEKGLVEKQEFKNGSVYRCVSKRKYHKIFGVKRENFSNKVLVEKKDKKWEDSEKLKEIIQAKQMEKEESDEDLDEE